MPDAKPPPILIVAGPTASGKSALALHLAAGFGGTIINADSMQIYRDLAVLTARPGPEEEAQAPHRLYGVIDAAETCSAGRWLELAEAEIAAARAAGRLPILVGGTGLYFRVLQHGLAEMPAIPAALREEARALYETLGSDAFRGKLAGRDPESAARIVAGDRQRLIRAYEVVTATDVTLPDWQRRQAPAAERDIAAVVLLPPRDVLYPACDGRFAAMIERGAAAEVRALLDRHLSAELPAMKAVGVRELAGWLAGQQSLEAAVAAAQQATRRLAKRQFTWLRHRMPEGGGLQKYPVTEQFSERLLPEIFSFIRQFLLTR